MRSTEDGRYGELEQHDSAPENESRPADGLNDYPSLKEKYKDAIEASRKQQRVIPLEDSSQDPAATPAPEPTPVPVRPKPERFEFVEEESEQVHYLDDDELFPDEDDPPEEKTPTDNAFALIPRSALERYMELPDNAKKVLTSLARHRNKFTGLAFPGIENIKKETHIDSDKEVQRMLVVLQEVGLVKRVGRAWRGHAQRWMVFGPGPGWLGSK